VNTKPVIVALWFAAAVAVAAAAHAAPPEKVYVPKPQDLVILYEHDGFGGHSVALQHDTLDLTSVNFNDSASSLKLRMGWQATFYEDVNGRGEWFVFNCPSKPIGVKQSDFCELKSIGTDIATGTLCEIRPRDSKGCVSWWNDRISGVGKLGPADESQPQGRIGSGHTD
jgi:hypothetical protein